MNALLSSGIRNDRIACTSTGSSISGRPINCVAHQTGGVASIASRTAAAVSTRCRLLKSHRKGAARYLRVGKLRLALEVHVILHHPRDITPAREWILRARRASEWIPTGTNDSLAG